jgi:transcriptional regulator with XRE-family HTH domain
MSGARRTAEQGSALVRRYEASGMSQTAFAEREGVSVNTIRYWLRKRRDATEEPVRFVEIVGETEPEQAACVVSVGGAEVRFYELPPPEYVAALACELRGDG